MSGVIEADSESILEASASLNEYRDPLVVSDVADILQVSERTIYRLVERGELEAVKIGHRLYFRKQALAQKLGF